MLQWTFIYMACLYEALFFTKNKSKVYPRILVLFLNVTILNSTRMVKIYRKWQHQQDFKRIESLTWFISISWILYWLFSTLFCVQVKCIQRHDRSSSQNARKDSLYQGLYIFFFPVYSSPKNTKTSLALTHSMLWISWDKHNNKFPIQTWFPV